MQSAVGDKGLKTRYKVNAYRPIPVLDLQRLLPAVNWDGLRIVIRDGKVCATAKEVLDRVRGVERALFEPWLLWSEAFDNLVVNAGLDDSLDKHLKGSSYTAAWYVGLTDGTPTPNAADTMSSHAGWTEVADYDEAARQTLTLGSVSSQSVDNSGNEATFTISSNSTTIGGAFVTSDNTKSGSSGTLYGIGAFSAGDKTLDDDDTLQVTITCTASAS